MPNPPTNSIYVGYMPMPKRVRRTVRIAVPVLVWLMLIPAYFWASAAQPAEPATWDTSASQTYTGTLVLDPYPFLVTDEGPRLIVEAGKIGSQARFDSSKTAAPSGPQNGATVTLTGYPLELGDRRMIELLGNDNAVQINEPPKATFAPTAPRAVILRGEIVDAKCNLGAMKPGTGPTHRACAMLCVRGGIPAVLVGFDALGNPGTWIVASPRESGATNETTLGPMDDRWTALIGQPVELRGAAVSLAGLDIVTPDAIRPIGR